MLLPLRIPVPPRPSGDVGLDIRNIMYRRDQEQQPPPASGTPAKTIGIVVGVIGGIILVATILFCYIRRFRPNKGKYRKAADSEALQDRSARNGRRLATNAVTETNRGTNRDSAASQVDRNTSIRSIMTLPAYRNKANDNEQVLGREGERDGVDVVVEFPTAEDEEAMRDEEMETMYQIRLARRQQNAEREERRRLQQEARERGDARALEELRARRRAETNDPTVSELRETHEQVKERRQRAVSSVSYADLGVARHDGTRLRANSTESERVGLLSDAASIAASQRSPSAQSNRRVSEAASLSLSIRPPSAQSQYHERERRGSSSVLSLDDDGNLPSPGLRFDATTPRRGSHHTRAGSSPEIIGEEDLADAEMPPPDYEDVSFDDVRSRATTPMFHEPPPDYVGPTGERDRRLSAHVADMAGHIGEGGDLSSPDETTPGGRSKRSSNRSSRGVGGVPQLPSLRFGGLPQIVIEPMSAHPSHRDRSC
ncbi:Uu.00g026360.m01.CDS01 [Anthostomella pinea]|uniref:Uu.00g026360.m01.CDS01 n=1 Tax=Anthostomella pinea TaxID=933095 RepID=A0AAI8V7K4_9PEZI|nr:Uu.00g026360.m01.CDS01 [Anthostomella pinea]